MKKLHFTMRTGVWYYIIELRKFLEEKGISRSEIRRLLKDKAIEVNHVIITEPKCLLEKGWNVRVGKKKFYTV